MRENYLVSEWALIRRNELVDIPGHFEIHPDFLQTLSHEEFESAFIGWNYKILTEQGETAGI